MGWGRQAGGWADHAAACRQSEQAQPDARSQKARSRGDRQKADRDIRCDRRRTSVPAFSTSLGWATKRPKPSSRTSFTRRRPATEPTGRTSIDPVRICWSRPCRVWPPSPAAANMARARSASRPSIITARRCLPRASLPLSSRKKELEKAAGLTSACCRLPWISRWNLFTCYLNGPDSGGCAPAGSDRGMVLRRALRHLRYEGRTSRHLARIARRAGRMRWSLPADQRIPDGERLSQAG